MKLLRLSVSPLKTKKWRAEFSDGSHTDFGASGYPDYTTSHDAIKRFLYIQRHAKDLNTNDPTRAGYLSYYILWGPTTSIVENARLYKNRFKL